MNFQLDLQVIIWQFGYLPNRGLGKVGAWLGHKAEIQGAWLGQARLGQGWGTVGAQSS